LKLNKRNRKHVALKRAFVEKRNKKLNCNLKKINTEKLIITI